MIRATSIIMILAFASPVVANYDHEAEAALALTLALKEKPKPKAASVPTATVKCNFCGSACTCGPNCGCDSFHSQQQQFGLSGCANGQCQPRRGFRFFP